MSKELRDYQIKAIEAIEKDLASGIGKCLLVMSMGLGKTYTAVKLEERLKSKKTMWLTDDEKLFEQSAMAFIREKFDDSLGDYIENIGFINYCKQGGMFAGSGYKMSCVKAELFDTSGDIVFCSAQTLWRRLDRMSADLFDVMIIDEAHCFPKGTKVDGRNIEDIKIGDFVKSFNHDKNIIELKEVKKIFKHKFEGDLIKIRLSNGVEFICTDNHPIYTKEFGYIKAVELSRKNEKNIVNLLYDNSKRKEKNPPKFLEAVHQSFDKRVCSVQENLCSKTPKQKYFGDMFQRLPRNTKGGLFNNLLLKMPLLQKNICKPTLAARSKTQNLLFKELQASVRQKAMEKDRGYLSCMWREGSYFWKKRFGESEKREAVHLFKGILQKSVTTKRFKKESACYGEKWSAPKVIREDEKKQPYVDGRHERKNDCFPEGQNISFSRREWRTYKTSINASSSDGIRHGAPDRNSVGKTFISKFANLLQGRFSSARSEAFNRGGRQDTQIEEVEVFRQKENRSFKFVRVESCEVYKRGSREFSEQMREEDYVYNIGVEENHNYFVNDTLVHNCFGSLNLFHAISHFNVRARIGLTGTPYRTDGMLMGDLFDKISFEYGMKEGIENGYLCELDAIRIKTTTSLDKVHTLGGEFNQKELSNEINSLARNNLIAESYLKYANGRQAIGYGVDITHCIDLAEAFKNKGINAVAISSDEARTGDSSPMVKAYRQKKIDVIFNVNMLSKGFDHPDTGCTIAAAPTKSLVRYLQGPGGRASRLKSAEYVSKFGQNAIILDIVDSTTRHNLVNAWELDKEKPLEDRVFTTKEKKEKILAERMKKKAVLEHERKEDEIVSLLKIPKYVVSKSIKMQEEATEAQLKWLKDLGHDTDTLHFTKYHANEIIGQLPASKKEIEEIKKLGYDVQGKNVITKNDYNAVKREIFIKLNKKSQPFVKR